MYPTTKLKQMFSSEQVFIILLCRLYFNTSNKAELEAFLNHNKLDATAIWKIASVHNIRPILYHVIHQHQINIDESLVARLQQFYLENQLRSLEQLAICNDVITSLKKENIDAIPFKGTTFSETCYGNSGLRESTDIDLLISSSTVLSAEKVLRDKGFSPKLAVPSSYINYYRKYFKEIVYTAPAKTRAGYSVEMHWKLLNYYIGDYPAFEFFNKRRNKVMIKNLEFNTLEPTGDFLAVVSNHFIKDLGIKFKYLTDVACLLHKKDKQLDHQLIAEIANKYNCRKKMDAAFQLTELFLGIKSGYVSRYKIDELHIKAVLSVPVDIISFLPSDIKFLKRSTTAQDNIRGKINFLLRSAFYYLLPTDNDLNNAASIKLPIPLLTILRPFRVFAKAISNRKKA